MVPCFLMGKYFILMGRAVLSLCLPRGVGGQRLACGHQAWEEEPQELGCKAADANT